jgi:ClpA/ClpB-like protein/ClpX C4-type zinc finger protein
MPDPALRDSLAARDRLRHAEDRAEELRIAYHQSIRRLHATGASMRDIADALGLSHQRVHQIVNGGGDVTTSRPKRKTTLLRRLTGRNRKGCDGPPGTAGAEQALDRFFVDARDAMSLAQEEASLLKHDYVGTEHVLLGLIRAQTGHAFRILGTAGLDLHGTREAIEHKLGRSESGGSAGAVRLTGRVKKVLELALREAKEHRSTHVRSEHLLLALAREGEGVGARILAERGMVYESLRRRVDGAGRACSFCGRSGIDVDHLIAGPGVFICERCAADASRLAAEVERGEAGARQSGLNLTYEESSDIRCSFCGKRRQEVDRLVTDAQGHSICDRCLALCREIQEEERRG